MRIKKWQKTLGWLGALTLALAVTVSAIMPLQAMGAVGAPSSAPQANEPPAPLPQIVLVPTDVQEVRALTNMNIRHGPSTLYPIVGKLWAGRTTAVISRTADYGWWQVVCPVGVYGDCFLSADPTLTRPVYQSGGDDSDLDGVMMETLDVRVIGSSPVQVQAVLTGYVPDSCTHVYSVEQVREGGTIRLRLSTARSQGSCAPGVEAYNEVVVLDVSGWPAGQYQVAVGPLQQWFTLPGSDHSTDVRWVLARAALPAYEGPGSGYPIAGYLRSGEIARVKGISSDGFWWRIECTTTYSGECYISISLADPTGAPGEDQYVVLPTDVEFVMAQVDVSIYEGPGEQYLPAGLLYAGQMAQVTGRTPDGGWWRVNCWETTARECYVSAHPSRTLPASAPTTAP